MEATPKFILSFGFSCRCGNRDPSGFYMMPAEVVRPDNSFGFSDHIYRLLCKGCKKEYQIQWNVKECANAEVKN